MSKDEVGLFIHVGCCAQLCSCCAVVKHDTKAVDFSYIHMTFTPKIIQHRQQCRFFFFYRGSLILCRRRQNHKFTHHPPRGQNQKRHTVITCGKDKSKMTAKLLLTHVGRWRTAQAVIGYTDNFGKYTGTYCMIMDSDVRP